MRKTIRNLLVSIVGLFACTVWLLGVVTLLLNTPYVQQRLLQRATTLLAERLNTRVEVSSVNANLFVPSLSLTGVSIDDQKGKPLLRMKELTAEMSVESLWKKDFVVKEVKTDGLEATLVKTDEDAVANYQFLIDAFSKKKPKKPTDNSEKKKNWRLALEPQHLKLTDTRISHQVGEKKTHAEMQRLDVIRKREAYRFDIRDLRLTTDNGKPHKKELHPKRGAFDAGHLNLTVNAKGTFQPVSKDSLNATLTQTTVQDSVAGIDINDLHLNATYNKKTLVLTDIGLKQGTTTLDIGRADITLPNKKTGKVLAYHSESISGHVVLKDIAKPLVPALREFHLPLRLTTEMSGTDNRLTFRNVRINTDDNRLILTAHGHIDHLRKGEETIVNFDVDQLHSRQGMAEKVINQFIVKKLMMNQLEHLGDIKYKGHFDVVRNCEIFKGRLTTNGGDLDFHFTVDGNSKHLTGGFSSEAVKVGDVMEMPSIGDVNLQANFDIDISKQRTAQIRREKGGKLPIGTVTATVNECSYKRIHLKNINIDIQSDGADAQGIIVQNGNRRQIHCNFIYNENNPKHKLRITNAGISFHKKQKDTEETPDTVSHKKKKLRGLFKKKSEE